MLIQKNVVYNVSDNLNTKSSLVALKLAIKQRKNKEMSLIHHSDRRLQYCSNEIKIYSIKMKFNPA